MRSFPRLLTDGDQARLSGYGRMGGERGEKFVAAELSPAGAS